MKKIFICWLEASELHVLKGSEDIGPIAKALRGLSCDEVHVISDLGPDDNSRYTEWLKDKTSANKDKSTDTIKVHSADLSGVLTSDNVAAATMRIVDQIKAQCREKAILMFHLNSGSPTIKGVFTDLAKTRYFPAALIESSMEPGDESVTLRFEWLGNKIRPTIIDQSLERLLVDLSPEAPEFSEIVALSPGMQKAVAMARRFAPLSVTVLIEGESGTGKELFARAIHQASPRYKKKLITVNCGAIPAELIESQLFGHKKGVFTGAHQDQKGYFEAADGGTLFLDEVGELSAQAQVKLLRVLESRKVMPLGSREEKQVNVRIIAATNRDIGEEVAAGKFRLDLYYRLAIGIITLPPLQERRADMDLLIEKLLARVNQQRESELGYKSKKLSVNAKNLLSNHAWPGNVRELLNTLQRGAIFSPEEMIREEDIKNSLLRLPIQEKTSARQPKDDIMNRPLGRGFDLEALIGKVKRHYLRRALKEGHGKKTVAAHLLGLNSHQTLNNWEKKYLGGDPPSD